MCHSFHVILISQLAVDALMVTIPSKLDVWVCMYILQPVHKTQWLATVSQYLMYFADYWHAELEIYQNKVFLYHSLYIKTFQYSFIAVWDRAVPKLA